MKAFMMTLAVALSLSTVACGGPCGGTCKDAADCEGASDSAEDDCNETCDEAYEDAKEAGCKKEFKDVMKCADVCDPVASLEDCEDEYTAYGKCIE